jgi:hypothetical protein
MAMTLPLRTTVPSLNVVVYPTSNPLLWAGDRARSRHGQVWCYPNNSQNDNL